MPVRDPSDANAPASPPFTVTVAARIDDPAALRALMGEFMTWNLAELARHLDHDLSATAIVDAMMADLGAYRPPRGATVLAHDAGGRLVGTCFLRLVRPDGPAPAGEIKRLYVAPAARGHGLGRRLMDAIMDRAREMGVKTLLLDTGVYLTSAVRLYESLGFTDIAPYPESDNGPELAGVVRWMALDLG